jgi:hypothetical protein
VPCIVFVNVHVVVPPAATVKVPGVPVEHTELVSCQPAGVASLMLNVFVGSTLKYVCVAVDAEVVSVVSVNPPPPVVVNANDPLPPTVFFTRMIVAIFALANVHVTVVPAATVNPDVDPPAQFELFNCHPACAVSVMV